VPGLDDPFFNKTVEGDTSANGLTTQYLQSLEAVSNETVQASGLHDKLNVVNQGGFKVLW